MKESTKNHCGPNKPGDLIVWNCERQIATWDFTNTRRPGKILIMNQNFCFVRSGATAILVERCSADTNPYSECVEKLIRSGVGATHRPSRPRISDFCVILISSNHYVPLERWSGVFPDDPSPSANILVVSDIEFSIEIGEARVL